MDKTLARQLYLEIAHMPCINSHSHLFPEATRLELDVDALVFFGHPYPRADLRAAGMPEDDAQRALKPGLPLDERWRLMASFEAANGIIIFGLSTAVVVATVQRVYFREEPARSGALDPGNKQHGGSKQD